MNRLTDGQLYSLRRLLGTVVDTEPAKCFIAGHLINRQLALLTDIADYEWRSIRNRAYPNWSNDDWEIAPQFVRLLAEWRDKWIESQGQLRLF